MEKDLEKARQMVQEDMKKRAEEAGKELQELLTKHNVTLQIGEQGIYIQANL